MPTTTADKIAIFVSIWGCLFLSYAYHIAAEEEREIRIMIINIAHGLVGGVFGYLYGQASNNEGKQ